MEGIERYSAEYALINTASPHKLKAIFEMCCETYAQRFCEMYDFNRNDCFWVNDEPGSVFIVNDVDYSLDMETIQLCVDRSVHLEEFKAWWNHEMNSKKENINLRSWLNGYHGRRREYD